MKQATQTFPKVLPTKNSTLCSNKEFFYTKNKPDTISEKEYKDAINCVINMDSVYFSLNNTEQSIYNKSLKIIQDYLSKKTK